MLIYVLLTCLYLIFNVIAVAYDPLDPTGRIVIKWDVISWTPDGYVVSIKIEVYTNNIQQL